jgi:hypothetical protein
MAKARSDSPLTMDYRPQKIHRPQTAIGNAVGNAMYKSLSAADENSSVSEGSR